MWMKEKQDDWDEFLPSALCTINSSKHATHGLQPNELMMGRKLRTPAELLRRSRLEYPHNDLGTYHEALIDDLQKAQGLAALALQKEQFDHELVTHCSFLLCYYYPTHLLDEMAKDFDMALREEAITAADIDSEDDAQSRDERVRPKSKRQILRKGPNPSSLKMVTKDADKMEQMVVDATVVSDLDQVKQNVLNPFEEERLIPEQLITEEKDTAVRREPELVVAPWPKTVPVVTKPGSTINVVTPE
ncbi:hypothetical protein PInf_014869 [Phytophthora infestans]|nr:hypothetical protein PInf_014869 [Phytophthora infestans]